MVAIDRATMPVSVTASSSSNSKTTTTKKKQHSPPKTTNLLTAMATKLNWTSLPSRGLPHGLTGILVVLLGGYLSWCAIVGDLGPYGLGPNQHYYTYTYTLSSKHHQYPQQQQQQQQPPSKVFVIKYVLYLFLIVSFINSTSGIMLAPKSTKMAQPIFRRGGITVICLVYYSMRFLPECYVHLHAIQPILLRALDIVFGILIAGATMSFFIVAYSMYPESKAISLAVATGSLGMLTFSAYPIQLFLFGNEWFECIVQTQHALQGVAMTAYIYVPSITVFSLCSFLPTLHSRKMITDVQLGLTFFLAVVGIVVVAVMSQELVVPDVSTQKLYIPCIVPTPKTNPVEYYIMDSLDVSKITRKFLRSVLGRSIPPPKYTEL